MGFLLLWLLLLLLFFCDLYPAAANPPNRRVIAGSRPICRERSRPRLGTRARGAWEVRRRGEGGGNIRIRIRCLHQISRSFMVSRGRARFWHAEARAGTLSKGNEGQGCHARVLSRTAASAALDGNHLTDHSSSDRIPSVPSSLFLTFSSSHCQ